MKMQIKCANLLFFKTDATNHNDAILEKALVRACAYAESGASGFFAPGLREAKYIERLCEYSPIPVNILSGHRFLERNGQ